MKTITLKRLERLGLKPDESCENTESDIWLEAPIALRYLDFKLCQREVMVSYEEGNNFTTQLLFRSRNLGDVAIFMKLLNPKPPYEPKN